MNKFKIGDICILHSLVDSTSAKFNGEEVVITSLPGFNLHEPLRYGIDGPMGKALTFEKFLKLKRSNGPEDSYKVVEWDDVGWKPNKVEECV